MKKTLVVSLGLPAAFRPIISSIWRVFMDKKLGSLGRMFIVFSVLACSGCTMLIADAVVGSYPTYQTVSAEWPAIKEGHGRVFIYFPRQGMKSFNPLGVGGLMVVPIVIDENIETTVGDRTFVFADLPQGKHVVSFKGPYRWSEKKSVEIDMLAGKVTYIELNHNYMNDTPPRIVDEAEALIALKSLHHNYKLPLPCNEQPRRALKAM